MPAAEGPLNWPLYTASRMLAACAAWRTRCGLDAEDEDAETKLLEGGAQQSIWVPALEDEDIAARLPVAVLYWGDAWHLPMRSGGVQNDVWGPQGQIHLLLATKSVYGENLQADAMDFGNLVGLVAQQLGEQAALDDLLSIVDVGLGMRPAICPQAEAGRLGFSYWTAGLTIDYGFGGGS